MLKTKKKPRRASGAKGLLRADQVRPANCKVNTPHDYCNSEGCQRCLAADDGRNLATVARNRMTPAHEVLAAVYAGLFYNYLPYGVDAFKKAFYKKVGGTS